MKSWSEYTTTNLSRKSYLSKCKHKKTCKTILDPNDPCNLNTNDPCNLKYSIPWKGNMNDMYFVYKNEMYLVYKVPYNNQKITYYLPVCFLLRIH